MFGTLHRRSIRWQAVDGVGLEHLRIEPLADRIEVRSVTIGERGGAPYGVHYTIAIDLSWRVTSFDIQTTDGRGLALVSPSEGSWRTPSGEPQPQFDGCIDIDLAGTPFTNTLPIRRLNLARASGTARLTMLYIPFDSFEPIRDGQHYTCLEDGRRYLYAAEDRTFTAELPVDEDGIVLDYPTLFTRL